jgi:hypothetical protein
MRQTKRFSKLTSPGRWTRLLIGTKIVSSGPISDPLKLRKIGTLSSKICTVPGARVLYPDESNGSCETTDRPTQP